MRSSRDELIILAPSAYKKLICLVALIVFILGLIKLLEPMYSRQSHRTGFNLKFFPQHQGCHRRWNVNNEEILSCRYSALGNLLTYSVFEVGAGNARECLIWV